MGQFGRGTSKGKRRGRHAARERLWWYQRGWRGVFVEGVAYLWRVSPWKPIIEVTVVDLADVPQGRWLSVIGDHIMGLRKDATRKVEGAVAAVIDEKGTKKWPVLMDHLTQTAWEDGTTRQTSTLSVFAGDGAFKALLKDRETQLCLWVASPSLEKLYDVLEAALVDPGSVWRRDRMAAGDKSSRVKGRTG